MEHFALKGTEEIISYLTEKFPKRLAASDTHQFPYGYSANKKVFKQISFQGHISFEFKNCKFLDCRFENVSGFFCLFQNCTFQKCTFINSRFSHIEPHWQNLKFEDCYFKSVTMDEGDLFNIYFQKCTFDMFYVFGFTYMDAVIFSECHLQTVQFQSTVYYRNDDLLDFEAPDFWFEDCILDLTGFTNVDLRASFIIDTVLYQSSFVNCKLSTHTIQNSKKLKFESDASIDLQTLLKSDDIDPAILKTYFKIHEPNIKKTMQEVSKVIDYKKVFISFSFIDKKIATRLYNELTNQGVRCFFWERDAPPGEGLKEIMEKNVKEHDRILFVASANSIKSEACQFELSEGRKKQAKTWEDTLFPIHIDDFLFEVKKDQIRPVTATEEYWKNIEELRRINSADFKRFNRDKIDTKKFKEAVSIIVRQLKLKPNN